MYKMRIKKIIKRGVKDTTWLDNFVKNRLQNNATHKAVCTQKMYYALSKYCRCLTYHNSRFSISNGLFFNNGIYAIEVREEGRYNKDYLYIYDIQKCIQEKINQRKNEYLHDIEKQQRRHNIITSEQEQKDFLRFFELEETANFNPFQSNFTLEQSYKIMNDFVDYGELVDKYE